MLEKIFNLKFLAAITLGIIFFANSFAHAAPGNLTRDETSSYIQWYWLSSDKKYSKYFDPDSVTVVKKATTDSGKEIPTEIEAWTKTTYTYEGADETIKTYGITAILPDPNILSYSLTLLRINPQTRTLQYAREDFYDKNNKIIWSRSDAKVKEINSRSFDEDFYASIVDEVFKQGEVDRKNSPDRWIDLWTFTNSEGFSTNASADTTTMQVKGTNLIFWEWQETKDPNGQPVEIRFMKKAVNLPQGTERIISGQIWSIATKRWDELDDEFSGSYRMIQNTEPDYKGLVRLRAFSKGYSTWVNRYSIS